MTTDTNNTNLALMSKSLTCFKPKTDQEFVTLGTQAISLSTFALTRVINSADDLGAATNDINIIKQLQKQAEEKLASYIKPFKEYIDEVKAAFKLILDPLEVAYNTNRAKSKAFLQEQERKQREAEEINRQKEELARREAAFKDGEVTINTEPVAVPPAIKRVRAETGSMSTMKIRKYRVVDFAKLPDQYKIENSALLNKVTKAGIHDILGVEFYFETTLRVDTR